MEMMMLMKSITPSEGFGIDPVSVKGVCIIPRILQPRNRKYVSPMIKDISNISKLTMNNSNQPTTVKSWKRIKQRELEDNYSQNKQKSQNIMPRRFSTDHRRQDESRQEDRNSKESELRVPRRSLSTGKSAWEQSADEDAHETQKSKSETKRKVFHKNVLKPIPYHDPALLLLRKERQRQRTEKTILKQQTEEKKTRQRLEIYALNEVMRKLEQNEFKEFCHISGINSEE